MPTATEQPPKKETPKAAAPVKETPDPKAKKPAEKPEGEDVPFIASLYGKPKAKEEAKKPEEKPAEKKPKPDETPEAKKPEAEKPTAPKKPKPAAPAPVAAPTAVEIGKAVAEAIKQPAAEKEKPEDIEAGLGFSERENIKILKHLEKKDAHKGRAKKYVESLKKSDTYEAEWASKNPGKEFDPTDAEHDAFFKSINVIDEIDEDEWKAAEKEVWTEEITSGVHKKLEPELEPVKAKQKLADEMPRIIANRVAAAGTFFSSLGEEYKGVLEAGGRINGAEVARLIQENPARQSVFEAAEKSEVFADQIHRLVRGLPELKPTEGRQHVTSDEVEQFAAEQESLIASLPEAPIEEGGQLDAQGRRFATAEKFNEMTPEKQKQHWRLDENKLRLMYAADSAAKARAAIETREAELEKFAATRGYVKNGTAAAAAAEPAKPKTEDVPPPNSPPGTVAPRMAQPQGGNGGTNGSLDSPIQSLYGKRE